MASRLVPLLSLLLVAASTAAGAATLVDDTGTPIPPEVGLEICVTREFGLDCSAWVGEWPDFGEPASSGVRVEGALHGPVRWSSREIRDARAAGQPLVVPRKADLVFRFPETHGGRERRPLEASLYPLDDPTARTPHFTAPVPSPPTSAAESATPTLKIPSGSHLLSLGSRGLAPDLHLVEAAPGGRVVVTYRPRPGWSLVVRAVDREGNPVSGAAVEVTPFAGYEPPGGASTSASGRRQARTGSHGFALFSGVAAPLAAARVEHPGFVPAVRPALTATLGGFDVAVIPLARGGTIEAHVTLDGEPVAEATCALLDRTRRQPGEPAPAPESVARATTGPGGTCRLERLPPGSWWFRATPPREITEGAGAVPGAVLDQRVQVVDEMTTPLEVALVPIGFEAAVFVDGEPAPGYGVEVSSLAADAPPEPLLRLATDETGEAAGTLWEPGSHIVHLIGPGGAPAAAPARRIEVTFAGERVEFHVAAGTIAGRVVDQDDRPVAEAVVALAWSGQAHRIARTVDDGTFSFAVEDGSGTARLEAHRDGYASSEPVELEVAPGVPAPPVVLLLARHAGVRGRLVTASGAPVAGGWVASYRVDPGRAPTYAGATRTELDGTFEVAAAPTATTRLFVAGPGCPLDVFEVPSSPGHDEEPVLTCAPAPAGVRLQVTDPEGAPLPGSQLLLRRDGLVVPRRVLGTHLGLLGLQVATDGRGTVTVPALAPGSYELFLSGPAYATSEETVAAGLSTGLVTFLTLAPGQLAELQVVAEPNP